MKWLPSENELIKEQRDFREKVWVESGNMYLSGFPGSGKSVCLLYAVKTIREKNSQASIIIVEFTHALIKMIQAALNELHLTDIPVVTYKKFESTYLGPYDFILCDEVQDMSCEFLALMKRRATRVIVGGDPNQSIYDTMPGGGATASVSDLMNILKPLSTELSIIHRLNKFLIRGIASFMPDMNILAEKSSAMKKHKPAYVWHCVDVVDEVERIIREGYETLNYGKSVGILFSSHSNVERFVNQHLRSRGEPEFDFAAHRYFGKPDYGMLNDHLARHGIKMQSITNSFGSLITGSDKIILSTYHSAKGLDFDKVFLPGCNETPTFIAVENDTRQKNEARLFMVAMSRSREDLILSYTTKRNRYIERFVNDRLACQFVDFAPSASPHSNNAVLTPDGDEADEW